MKRSRELVIEVGQLVCNDVANMQSIERKILHSLEATTWHADEESDCTHCNKQVRNTQL